MERFWTKVEKTDGCWNWTACCGRDGYGQFHIDGKWLRAHRYSLELKLGRPIAAGMQANHTCKQNHKCVNPHHLYEGTHQENMDDMKLDGTVARGDKHGSRLHPERLARGDKNGARLHPERLARGEKNANAKLTEDTVKEIRILREFGYTQMELAGMYGVNQTQICRVVNNKYWSHI